MELADSTVSDEGSSSVGLASSEIIEDRRSCSSDGEEDISVEAGADLRRGVDLDFAFVDLLLAFGRGGLNAGRPRFAGWIDDDDVGMIR